MLQFLKSVRSVCNGSHPLLTLNLVKWRRTKNVKPFLGKLAFVIQVGVIGNPIYFVREPERQFLVQTKIIRVVTKSPVSYQINSSVHPGPTFLGSIGQHGNVVRHVVPMETPHLRKARL